MLEGIRSLLAQLSYSGMRSSFFISSSDLPSRSIFPTRAFAFAIFHRLGRPFVGNDDGGRRKDKVARRMIGMRFSIDEKANRQGRKLFDRGQYGSGVRRVMAAVNKNDSFLGQNNSTIGIQFLSDIDIDAVFKLLNLRPEILRFNGSNQQKRNDRCQNQRRLCFHTPLLLYVNPPRRY